MTKIYYRRRSFESLFACTLLLLSSLFAPRLHAETDPKFYAVQASAVIQVSPPQVTLVWPADGNATGYTISRKAIADSAWSTLGSLPGGASTFVDSHVSTGVAYEYQLSKSTSVGYQGFGYVCAGLNAPLIEGRGKLLLLVDNLYALELANELSRLQQDLVGDGWTVVRRDVPRNDSAANIKTLILSEYRADPANVKALFLFGHIPVPYSGNLNPDGHPDHQGAWPADAYYGDMDGSWTDDSVSNTSAQRQANWNVPGDGKFDQSELPSDVELEVGRVDLSNMTCFSNKTPARYEKDLLKQYLNKDHNFRHGFMAIQRRGLVCDNFGEKDGEAFAASGWRNFSAFFGAENVTSVPGWNYFSTLSSQSYLWSYGCGGGSYYTCNGIGSSDDFANTDIKSVFTLFLGSYFGDWDNESNFLRAPLGSSSSTLAVGFSGRPHWFVHHMGVGETIGYSARVSQNNRQGGLYSAQNYSTRGIHVALLGDPSLRLHPVIPPSGLTGTILPDGVALSWTASPDTALQGYHVYRSAIANGPFARITGASPITETSFTDSTGPTNSYYMVRAIKLETSASGTYLNPSQGQFFGPDSTTSWGSGPAVSPSLPPAPSALKATVLSAFEVSLTWSDTARDEIGFKVERKEANGTYARIAVLGGNVTTFHDTGAVPGSSYLYRVSTYNIAGDSSYSNEASASTPSLPVVPASAAFLGVNTQTGGAWNGTYGSEGFELVGTSSMDPPYTSVQPSGQSPWTWAWSTTDPRALQKDSSTDRLAACWFSSGTFSMDVNLRDGQPHRLAVYCIDWDGGARRQTVEVLDASTGAILNSQALTDFHSGAYLAWNIAGHVVVRFTRQAGANACVSGIFFDPPVNAPLTAATPQISPDGGKFSDPTVVTLSTTTSGATIRYTLDGTEPTVASQEYVAPFTLRDSAIVKAKAFANGLAESATARAPFTLNPISSGPAQVLFVRADAGTQGNWKGIYGTDGYKLAGDNPANIPDYVQLGSPAQTAYVWSDSTTDARALQQATGNWRVAGCWSSESSFSADVDFTDSRTHRLALYFLDWDAIGRSETVEILDATTGALLSSQSITGFTAGKYLVWDIKGHVQVRCTRLAGNNAVLMGLFFSAAAIQLGDPGSGSLAVASSALIATGGLHLQLSGQVGQRFAIQASTDFINWKEIRRLTLTSRVVEVVDSEVLDVPARFYRALPVSAEDPPQ